MEIQMVDYDYKFLQYSWDWLNDPEIKKLTNTNDFSIKDQREWFDNLNKSKDYLIWGILADSKPIGACGLKKITKKDCEYWGYIGEKLYWGKGIGKIMLNSLEQIAKEMNLKSIWLKVLKDNIRAINLYKKAGYEVEKEDHELIYMRKFL